MVQISWLRLIAAAFGLSVAIASGTFGITVLAKDAEIVAVDRQNTELKEKLEDCLQTASNTSGLVTVLFRILDSNISNQGDRLWDNDMA